VRTPEITYRYIYAIDVAGPTFEVVSRGLTVSASNAIAAINFEGVPSNKVLVLTNVTMHGNPGATQACIALTLSMRTSANAEINVMQETFPVDADENQTLNWQGELYIPGRGDGNPSVGFTSVYDAGVNANVGNFALQGVIIPRGNVATF